MASIEIFFGQFPVTKQVFYKTKLSFALVNLMPLLPGHVLVCPRRVVHRYKDLTQEEIIDHTLAVQKVSRMIERVFKAEALNIAIQDGYAAGQTIPHLHTHIIPRKEGDLPRKDDIYPLMESEGASIASHLEHLRSATPIKLDPAIKPRSAEDMHKEAEWLREEMKKELDEGEANENKL